jgi:3-phenylpropionate/trans-cinnamate dioxygenase ferredoxin subunit
VEGRWVRVVEAARLENRLGVQVDGHDLALFRLEDGVYALDDICSHEFSRLSEGEMWEGEVYCPKHGSRFNIRSGSVTGLPATQPVGTYAAKEEDGWIYVQWDR